MRIVFTTSVLLVFCCSLVQAQQQSTSRYTIEDPNQALQLSIQNNPYFEMPQTVNQPDRYQNRNPNAGHRSASSQQQGQGSQHTVKTDEVPAQLTHQFQPTPPRVDMTTRPQSETSTTLINPAQSTTKQMMQTVSATSEAFGSLPNSQPATMQDFVVKIPPQPQYFQNDMIMQQPDGQLPSSRQFFFGFDPDDACDEWDGFARCGGLKQNPGHWGIRWLRSTDACEPQRDCHCHKCQKKVCRQCKQPGESCRCGRFPRPNLPGHQRKPVCNCDNCRSITPKQSSACQTADAQQGLLNVAQALTTDGWQQR